MRRALACLFMAGAAQAAEPGQRWLEAGAETARLSRANPAWRASYLRLAWQTQPGIHWDGELAQLRRFNVETALAAAGVTRKFGPRWSGRLALAASSDGNILPRIRADLAAYRKWGTDSELVGMLGLSLARARDGHRDRMLTMSLMRYGQGWVAEGGATFSRSDPGSVAAHAQWLALHVGSPGSGSAVLRVGRAREAWQSLGATTVTAFNSRQAALGVRYWFTPRWGTHIEARHYESPHYQRRELAAGVFHEF